jgi:ATP-dependent Clp protease protease subunit
MPTNRKTAKTLGSSRVVFLSGEINKKSSREVIDKLIAFDKKSAKDILLIIDSWGGDVDLTISIYLVILLLRSKVCTLALANCSSAAAILLASGAAGKRIVMPQSIVMLHDISSALNNDYHKVLENEIKSLRMSKQIINNILEEHGAGDAVKLLTPEATYMLGAEAIQYKLADVIIKNLDELYKVVNI